MGARVSEPPKGSLFSFKQYGCTCNVEKHYEDDGTTSYWLHITSNKNKEIELYHDFKKGLNISELEENDFKDVVHEFPQSYNLKILIKKLEDIDVFSPKASPKIVAHDEEQYAYEMKSFFERFGFLFPLPENPVLVSVREAGYYLDRAYIVSLLISEIKNDTRPYGYDYNRLFYYTFMLSMSNARTLKLIERSTNSITVFNTPVHPLSFAISTPAERTNGPYDISFITVGSIFKTKISEEKIDILKSAYLNEIVGTSENIDNHEFTQSELDKCMNMVCFLVEDTFSNKTVPVIANKYPKHPNRYKFRFERKRCITDIQNLQSHYIHTQATKNEKTFYDYFLNFYKDMKSISIKQSEYIPFEFLDDVNIMKLPFFKQRYKDVLLELARETIKHEMDQVLKSVIPQFYADEMMPGWLVPNLYTAIYYSLFLNSGNERIEKACANPTCLQTFPVEKSNLKHQYCSDSCSNCMRQRRYKENKVKREIQNRNSSDA